MEYALRVVAVCVLLSSRVPLITISRQVKEYHSSGPVETTAVSLSLQAELLGAASDRVHHVVDKELQLISTASRIRSIPPRFEQ